MALKAGYKGVKKNLIDFINTLVGSVVIKSIGDGLDLSEELELSAAVKSIGDGLDLSEAGELSSEIKSIGTGLSLSEAGELSCSVQAGTNYSTDEQSTGLKWTDGKTIYQRTYTGWSLGSALTDSWKSVGVTEVPNKSDIAQVIDVKGLVTIRENYVDYVGYLPMSGIKVGNDLRIKADATSGTPVNCVGATFWYTKN